MEAVVSFIQNVAAMSALLMFLLLQVAQDGEVETRGVAEEVDTVVVTEATEVVDSPTIQVRLQLSVNLEFEFI